MQRIRVPALHAIMAMAILICLPVALSLKRAEAEAMGPTVAKNEIPAEPEVEPPHSQASVKELPLEEVEEIAVPEVEEITSTEVTPDRQEIVRVSHYWPSLGGVNCSSFVNGYCVSRMANGERWEDFLGIAIACPKSWEFGTVVSFPDFGDREFICKDRGGKINYVNGVAWVDLLIEFPLAAYGTLTMANITVPK